MTKKQLTSDERRRKALFAKILDENDKLRTVKRTPAPKPKTIDQYLFYALQEASYLKHTFATIYYKAQGDQGEFNTQEVYNLMPQTEQHYINVAIETLIRRNDIIQLTTNTYKSNITTDHPFLQILKQ